MGTISRRILSRFQSWYMGGDGFHRWWKFRCICRGIFIGLPCKKVRAPYAALGISLITDLSLAAGCRGIINRAPLLFRISSLLLLFRRDLVCRVIYGNGGSCSNRCEINSNRNISIFDEQYWGTDTLDHNANEGCLWFSR